MDDWEPCIRGFLQCLELPGEVKGFDKAAFKRDILEIIEGLMQQVTLRAVPGHLISHAGDDQR